MVPVFKWFQIFCDPIEPSWQGRPCVASSGSAREINATGARKKCGHGQSRDGAEQYLQILPTLIPSNFLPTRTRLQTLGGERRQSIHGYTGQPAAALALTLRTALCTFCFKSPKQSTNKLPNWPPTSNVCCTCNNQDTPVVDSSSGLLSIQLPAGMSS